MAKRFTRGLHFLRRSFSIIKKNKKLILLPAMGTILSRLLLATILIPLSHYQQSNASLTQIQLHHVLWLYLIFLVLLSISHFITQFFDAALSFCLQNYFKGKKPGLMQGLKAAVFSFWRMVVWNTFASTMGIFIYFFPKTARKLKFIDQILGQQYWNSAIFFVIPLLVMEKKSLLSTVETSKNLIEKTWGTQLNLNFSYRWVMSLAHLLFLFPLLMGWAIGGKQNLLIGSAITVVLYLITATLNSYVRVVLYNVFYLYAKEGLIAPFFDKAILQEACVASRGI
jgi:hypothetical protein